MPKAMRLFSRSAVGGKNRLNFDTWDELNQFCEDMHLTGFSWSPAEPYQATCYRCRTIVDISIPRRWGLEYAQQHRSVCGPMSEA